jgi:hypothetical protein
MDRTFEPFFITKERLIMPPPVFESASQRYGTLGQ